MKKTVRVTIEKEFEIDIPEFQLTDEHIAMFESGIFKLGDNESSREAKINELFKYAGRMAAYGYSETDGIGEVGETYKKKYAKDPDYFVAFEEIYDDCETEIVE